MATYNGENYINNQIDSILGQEDVLVDILISDDGSNDSTLEIINKYIKNNKNIKLIKNSNVHSSSASNFYNLIINCEPRDYDFIALSDQDDIFDKYKFSYSKENLIKTNSAFLSSSVKCFDSSSNVLIQSGSIRKYDFLFEGAGQGCSFVMQKIFLMI